MLCKGKWGLDDSLFSIQRKVPGVSVTYEISNPMANRYISGRMKLRHQLQEIQAQKQLVLNIHRENPRYTIIRVSICVFCGNVRAHNGIQVCIGCVDNGREDNTCRGPFHSHLSQALV